MMFVGNTVSVVFVVSLTHDIKFPEFSRHDYVLGAGIFLHTY